MKKRLAVLFLAVAVLLSGNARVVQAQDMNLSFETDGIDEVKETISLFQVEDYTKTYVKFSWFSDGDNDGFFIYRKCKYDDDYKKIGTVENLPYTTHYFQDDSFVPGIAFTYKVVAYSADDMGNVTEGQSVSESIQVSVPKVKISSVKRSGGRAVVKWKKAARVSGYEVFAKTGNGSYKKMAAVTDGEKTEYTSGKASTGKTVKYKVRAFVTYNGEKLYGNFSAAKKICSIAVQQIINKFKQLQKKYPTGKYWNHVNKTKYNSTTVTTKPCMHLSLNDISTCNYYYCPNGILGYQCYGFAWKMSDLIYGKKAGIKTFKSFDKCKMGDVIRYDGHSVIITEKHKNYVVVGECNYGNTCRISWGREVYKSDLKNATYSRRY